MPRGDKSKYTGKQARKADHIAHSYESRGVSEQEAERRAWATVNKEDGGGKAGVPAWAFTQRTLPLAAAEFAVAELPPRVVAIVQPPPRKQRRCVQAP